MSTGTELFTNITGEVDATINGYGPTLREKRIREILEAAGYSSEALQPLQVQVRSLDDELRLVCTGLVERLGLQALRIHLGEQDAEAPQPKYEINVQFKGESNPLFPPLMTGADIGDILLSDEYTLELTAKQDPVTLIVSFVGEGSGHQGVNYKVLVRANRTISVGNNAVSEPRGSKLLGAVVKDLIQYTGPQAQV